MKRHQGFKRVMSFLSAVLLLIWMIPFANVSAVETGEGFTYDSSLGLLTISDINGPMNFYNYYSVEIDNVTDVVFTSSVEAIMDLSFYEYTNLRRVTIPASVTGIGEEAFYHCEHLERVTFEGNIPPDIYYNVFVNCPAFLAYVPVGRTTEYESIRMMIPSGSEILDYVPVRGVSLDDTSIILSSIGAQTKLDATITPNDAADQRLEWTSNNPDVATVDSSGNVQAIGPGDAYISVRTLDGDYTDTLDIYVLIPAAITIGTQPQDTAETIYGYSYANAPTMTFGVSKTASAPINSTISYQWYRVKSGVESNDVAVGTDSATLTMPVGLPVGTYEFYCVATCDATTLTSQQASFSVLQATPVLTIDYVSTVIDYANNFYLGVYVNSIDGPNLMGTLSLYEGTSLLQTIDVTAGEGLLISNDFTAGEHTVYAKFTPATDTISKNYKETNTDLYSFSVLKGEQDLFEISPIPGYMVGDGSFTLETTGGKGNGAVTYSVPADNGILEITGNEATIRGAGTVRITATIAADDNFKSATTTLDVTIEKGNTWIEFNPTYDVLYPFTAEAIPNPTEEDIAVTGGTYSDVTFTWYNDSFAPENVLSGTPALPGTYVLVASLAETDDYSGIETSLIITIVPDTLTLDILYNDSTSSADWYKDDVEVSATGYSVSDTLTGPFMSSYVMTGEGSIEKTLYFKNALTGRITSGQLVTVNIDRTAPTFSGTDDGVMIDGMIYNGLQSDISFDMISNSSVKVNLSATDTGSQMYLYYFFLDYSESTQVLTPQKLDERVFVECPDAFSIASPGTYVLYAYAVDWAGNRSDYICSQGFVIDLTNPDINLTPPDAADITETSGSVDASMNETGSLNYIIRTYPASLDAQDIITAGDVYSRQVSTSDIGTDLSLDFSNLTPNTTYYVSVVGQDLADNTSLVQTESFTTKRIVPTFAGEPTVIGVYGQQMKDMQIQQLTSTNGVQGTWSTASTDVPSVGTAEAYTVQFTPENPALYDVVTVQVVPQVSPRDLTSTGVTISEVTESITYNESAWAPVVSVTDSGASMSAKDYVLGYSDNINAGTATITITGQGNYTGTVTRFFAIDKALAPEVIFPNAESITYGQTLSDSVLVGGSTEYGTFSWETPDIVPTVGSGPKSNNVVFTPSTKALANYDFSTLTKNVSVIILQAVPVITFDVSLSGSVGSRVATITVRVSGIENGLVPTGEVFMTSYMGDVGFEEVGSALLENGVATYQWSGLAEKIYKLYVAYDGDENYKSRVGEIMWIDVSSQRTPVEEFVFQMYLTALERKPDSTGFDHWVEQINGKKATAAQVAYGFFFSNECQSRDLTDREFVSLLYRGMLGRDADAQGLENCLDLLKTGVSRKYIFASFITSQEWINHCSVTGIAPGTYASDEGRDWSPTITAFVLRMYSSFLGRPADVAGLNYWTSLLNQSKISGAEVSQSFAFSQELLAKNLSNEAFVDLMYQGILGRGADSAGKAYWMAQLAAGMSRMDVFRVFVNSQEFANLCARYGIERGSI